MIPMLDETIGLPVEPRAATRSCSAWRTRGRLNVAGARARAPVRDDLREFEGRADARGRRGTRRADGDASTTSAPRARAEPAGEITVTLASNPSQLEAVDPVVEGLTRADQTDRSTCVGYVVSLGRDGGPDPRRRGLPGPGRRRGDAEPRRPGRLLDRRPLHVIANDRDQLHHRAGDARSTCYRATWRTGLDLLSSTCQRHDPRRPRSAVRLAMAFRRLCRQRCGHRPLGYRRHGHDEQDEAA